MQHEVAVMRGLQHRHLLPFYGYTLTPYLCLVTPLLPRGNLQDHIARLYVQNKRLSLARVVRWASEVTRALNWVHQKGVIHRDVKSANVLLGIDGSVVLCDFGLAHIKREPRERKGRYGNWGTLTYSAPEVLRGASYSYPADLYSLGVVIAEMVCLPLSPFLSSTFSTLAKLTLAMSNFLLPHPS
jgi:serine/threonine protein kinase